MLLILAFTFSSCTWCEVEVPRYVEATCPRIEVLQVVPRIDVNISSDGAIRGTSMLNLINGASMLRKSETYYLEQLTTYNNSFVDK